MPSASEELKDEVRLFIPGLSDITACKYLEDSGYTLSPQWEWSKPGVETLADMTDREYLCLLYLVHEWDYGALA